VWATRNSRGRNDDFDATADVYRLDTATDPDQPE